MSLAEGGSCPSPDIIRRLPHGEFIEVHQPLAGVDSRGGIGLFGESQRVLSDRYPSVLAPARIAFSVWSVIYLGLLLYAVYQSLPRQRVRPVHRAVGWLFVATTALNTSWIVIFSRELIGTAQLVIVALLLTLAVVIWRLAAVPASGVNDRVLVYGPMALYAGWVSLATVAGFSVTLTYWGAALGPVTGALVLLVAIVAVCYATFRTAVAVPYAAMAVWVLFWITVEATGAVGVGRDRRGRGGRDHGATGTTRDAASIRLSAGRSCTYLANDCRHAWCPVTWWPGTTPAFCIGADHVDVVGDRVMPRGRVAGIEVPPAG